MFKRIALFFASRFQMLVFSTDQIPLTAQSHPRRAALAVAFSVLVALAVVPDASKAGPLVGGSGFGCALNGGAVYCWGAGGRLGDGTTIPHAKPLSVSGLHDVTSLAAGAGHACALKSDGTVWCWGFNNHGQIGDGTTLNSLIPLHVAGLAGVIALAASNYHTCAAKSDGKVWCWGYNNVGQIGDGTTTERPTPTLVSGISGVRSLAAGGDTYGSHSCALKTDGSVLCWGFNLFGQLGDGTTDDRATPTPVINLSGVAAITAKFYQTCALKSDGTAACWGNNTFGQIGDGTLSTWWEPVAVSGLTGAIAISAGRGHTCALKAGGAAWCWGSNEQGELGDGTTRRRLTPVAVKNFAGATVIAPFDGNNTCAMKADGSVWCWGDNYSGEIGDGTTSISVSTHPTPTLNGATGLNQSGTGSYHTCAVKSDASVMCWGDNDYGELGDGTREQHLLPVAVPGLQNVVSVAASSTFSSCARKSDGTVLCWGYNIQGQLGDGTTSDRLTPVPVQGLGAASDVSMGSLHTCAVKTDATVACWGLNAAGDLGDGTTDSHLTPVVIAGFSGVMAVATGDQHTCALKSTGTVWCWGDNGYGQLGLDDGLFTHYSPTIVPGISGITSLSAGANHTCAINAAGSAWCWGNNISGQLGDGTLVQRRVPTPVTGLSEVKSIAAGLGTTCALKQDSTVWCWGYNGSGAVGDGTTTMRPTPIQVPGVSGVSKIAVAAHVCAVRTDGKAWCWGYDYYAELGIGEAGFYATPRRSAAFGDVILRNGFEP